MPRDGDLSRDAHALSDMRGIADATRSWVGFLREYIRVVLPYWNAERKWRTRALAAVMILLCGGLVAIVIAFNFWNARLFNALEQRSFAQFLGLLGLFAILLLTNMAVNALSLIVRRYLQIQWRQWLTGRIIGEWLDAGRHYQLTFFPGEHDNPDGRIAEDIRVTVEGAIELTHSLIYNAMQLISFIDILWMLSGLLTFRIGDTTLSVPGHMVWIALIYALIGAALALLIGRPLVGATNLRQSEEANFRFGLVRARENSESIALIRGEADERRRLGDLFAQVMAAWRQQSTGLVRILMFTTAYGMLATTFPLIIASPRYIMGMITLGALVQTAQAFQMVTSALSWPVDNLAKLAEWRASAGRILSFTGDLDAMAAKPAPSVSPQIRFDTSATAELVLEGLAIAPPMGVAAMTPISDTIRLGDHILVGGDPELTERLPRVLARLWPWGAGRVALPGDAEIFFVPEHPYLPIGPLYGAVCYPTLPESCDIAAIPDALRRLGLGHLIARQGETAAWEQQLTRGERQLLGFARLLVHRPRWLVLEDATNALDAADKATVMAVLASDFAAAAVVTIGNGSNVNGFYHRKINFTRERPAIVAEPDAQAVKSLAAKV